MFHELSHARYGKLTAMRRASRIGGERESSPLPPPALGEHTQQVLAEFGFDPAEFEALRAAGLV
jgi:formyl-CoA transferase